MDAHHIKQHRSGVGAPSRPSRVGNKRQSFYMFTANACMTMSDQSRAHAELLEKEGHPNVLISKPMIDDALWLQLSKIPCAYMDHVVVLNGDDDIRKKFLLECAEEDQSLFVTALRDRNSKEGAAPLYSSQGKLSTVLFPTKFLLECLRKPDFTEEHLKIRRKHQIGRAHV